MHYSLLSHLLLCRISQVIGQKKLIRANPKFRTQSLKLKENTNKAVLYISRNRSQKGTVCSGKDKIGDKSIEFECNIYISAALFSSSLDIITNMTKMMSERKQTFQTVFKSTSNFFQEQQKCNICQYISTR